MKISVIIPVYNEEGEILDCLKSLGNQIYKDFEIIAIDDGSTDKTSQLLKDFKGVLPAFRLIGQDHKGAGAARNLGAKKAIGEILVFVDADMTFDKNFIFSLVQPIILGKSVGTFSKDEYLGNKESIWAICCTCSSR